MEDLVCLLRNPCLPVFGEESPVECGVQQNPLVFYGLCKDELAFLHIDYKPMLLKGVYFQLSIPD